MIRCFRPAPGDRTRLLLGCVVIVVIHAVLFQVMARTGVIEKVMAFTCSWWELLLIFGFLVSRILSYLLVPPLLLALATHALLSWRPRRTNDWSEEYGEG